MIPGLVLQPANAEDSSRRGPQTSADASHRAGRATLVKKPVERNRLPRRSGLWAFKPVSIPLRDARAVAVDGDHGREGLSSIG